MDVHMQYRVVLLGLMAAVLVAAGPGQGEVVTLDEPQMQAVRGGAVFITQVYSSTPWQDTCVGCVPIYYQGYNLWARCTPNHVWHPQTGEPGQMYPGGPCVGIYMAIFRDNGCTVPYGAANCWLSATEILVEP